MNEHEISFTVTLLLIRYQVSLGDVSTGAVESSLSSEEDELQGFAHIPFHKDGGLQTGPFPHK